MSIFSKKEEISTSVDPWKDWPEQANKIGTIIWSPVYDIPIGKSNLLTPNNHIGGKECIMYFSGIEISMNSDDDFEIHYSNWRYKVPGNSSWTMHAILKYKWIGPTINHETVIHYMPDLGVQDFVIAQEMSKAYLKLVREDPRKEWQRCDERGRTKLRTCMERIKDLTVLPF